MKKPALVVLSVILMSCTLFAQSPVIDLAEKLPDDTVGFIGTSGTDQFCEVFQRTPLGQICNDAGVKDFFSQIISSFSQQDGIDLGKGLVPDAPAALKDVFAFPMVLGFSIDPDPDPVNPGSVYLIVRDTSGKGKLDSLCKTLLAKRLANSTVVVKEVDGYRLYHENDPNATEVSYAGQIGEYFIASFNDPDYKLIKHIISGRTNTTLSAKLTGVSAGQDAVTGLLNIESLMGMLKQEIEKNPSDQKILDVLDQLGLAEMEYLSFNAGFDNNQIVANVKLQVPTHKGIWDALQPTDQQLFAQADAKSIRATSMHVDIGKLYDEILDVITPKPVVDPNQDPRLMIAQFEKQIGFKIREQFLESLEGSCLFYSLPSYSMPQLPTGGYVLTAKLTDAERMGDCLQKMGPFLQVMSNGQMQVSLQKSASGKQIHAWPVSFLAMMQMIPSWGIEGNTLVIASHPILTGQVLDRISAGRGDNSILSKPDFYALLNSVPPDAFGVTLTDSQAQGRQIMLMAQQFWPMVRMMMSKQGMNLPIMVPSVDQYIAQMKPGLCYGRKSPTGLEWYYRGSGVEISSGSVAGGAMGMAILMPALSKTRKIAQQVVSGTNLKGIGTACVVYANDHDGRFPDNFDVLIREYDVSPKSLESPRKPNGFDGADYILIKGLTDAAPATVILAYENPDFCQDKLNVLYADGHVEAVERAKYQKDMAETQFYLIKNPVH